MVLGFNPRFVGKIISGTKIHTIRADIHNRWKAGRSIQFATGVRTKYYQQFKDGVCVSTQKIVIDCDVNTIGDRIIIIDDRQLTEAHVFKLAKNDGFNSLEEFYDWFNKPFVGKIIHWTEKRY